MSAFQNDIQNLKVSDFNAGEMTPIANQAQPYLDDPRLCVGFCGGCGGCFGGGFFRCGGFCGGFNRCGGFCGGFHRCGGCGRCGGCARCF